MDAHASWLDRSNTILATALRPEVEILLRALLHAQANGDPRTKANTPQGGAEVVFSTEIDGTLFVLLSIPPVQPQQRPLFSPREIEIARMVAQGYANKTIAAVLEISVNTVNTHLRRIFAKLGVTTRAAMVTSLANQHNWAHMLDSAQPGVSNRVMSEITKTKLPLIDTR